MNTSPLELDWGAVYPAPGYEAISRRRGIFEADSVPFALRVEYYAHSGELVSAYVDFISPCCRTHFSSVAFTTLNCSKCKEKFDVYGGAPALRIITTGDQTATDLSRTRSVLEAVFTIWGKDPLSADLAASSLTDQLYSSCLLPVGEV